MPKALKEGAIFIADAHYPHHGEALIDLLRSIENQTIQTPQLFLMGDIFDLLFGYNRHIQTFATPAITLLQKLSQTLEIHYLEGNHDFCLQELFPDIYVYPREEQPIEFSLANKPVYLAHGDRYETGLGYDLYSSILRNPISLTLLKPFEKPIINHQIKRLQQKTICGKFQDFEKRVNKIMEHYPKNTLVIEGHFHQGRRINNYISLPSLVCQKQIGVIRDQEMVFEKI